MRIQTSRFGAVQYDLDDIIVFPAGLIGLEECRQWLLLADAENDALGWLQCTTRPDVAMAVVSPRRFVSEYQVRVLRSELDTLKLETTRDAQVLVVACEHEGEVTLNLKGPLVLNLDRRLGRQVIHLGDEPIRHRPVIDDERTRKSA